MQRVDHVLEAVDERHAQAVRQVAFHRRYPLLASAGDDGTVHVFHAMVYDDLNRNPLLVPVQILRDGEGEDANAQLNCVWHPRQPWVFSAGADGTEPPAGTLSSSPMELPQPQHSQPRGAPPAKRRTRRDARDTTPC